MVFDSVLLSFTKRSMSKSTSCTSWIDRSKDVPTVQVIYHEFRMFYLEARPDVTGTSLGTQGTQTHMDRTSVAPSPAII